VYHVTARGNERCRTFRDDQDRQTFLATLVECVQQHGLRVHGYCLMPNHYHLLLETPRGNLSRAMGWFQTTYTIRFNRRHRRCGHLFQGRFKAHLVEADAYAMELLRYVHLNPVRPRNKTAPIPMERRAALLGYRWSSHGCYLGIVPPPDWLCLDWLSFFERTRKKAQSVYEQFVEDAFETAIQSPWSDVRRSLVLGSDAFEIRVRGLLQKNAGTGEVAWTPRVEEPEKGKTAARTLADEQDDRRWKAWVLARLGHERGVDIARELGFKDGSAITHLLKRLESKLPDDPALARHRAALESEFQRIVSSVKR